MANSVKTEKPYIIKRDDQLAVLAVPVRQMILDCVAASDEDCSIKEIASMLKRQPDSLYFHVAKLVDTGLLIKSGKKTVVGKEVQLYTTPSKYMGIRYDLDSDLFKERIAKIGSSMLRLVDRDFKAGLNSAKSKCEGSYKNHFVTRAEGYVSIENIKKINEHIEKIYELLLQNSTDECDARIAVNIALTNLD